MPTIQPTPRTRSGLPGKRATNLSLSTDVLDAAKQLEINISQVCDTYLREGPYHRRAGLSIPGLLISAVFER